MKRDPEKEKNLNVRFPLHVWERLEEQAQREGYSKNAMIIHSIIVYLNDRGYSLDMIDDFTDFKGERREEENAQ